MPSGGRVPFAKNAFKRFFTHEEGSAMVVCFGAERQRKPHVLGEGKRRTPGLSTIKSRADDPTSCCTL